MNNLFFILSGGGRFPNYPTPWEVFNHALLGVINYILKILSFEFAPGVTFLQAMFFIALMVIVIKFFTRGSSGGGK